MMTDEFGLDKEALWKKRTTEYGVRRYGELVLTPRAYN